MPYFSETAATVSLNDARRFDLHDLVENFFRNISLSVSHVWEWGFCTSQLSALRSPVGLVTCHFPCVDCLLGQDVWREVKDFVMVS